MCVCVCLGVCVCVCLGVCVCLHVCMCVVRQQSLSMFDSIIKTRFVYIILLRSFQVS